MKRASPGAFKLVARDIRPDARKRVSLGPALDNLDDASFDVYRDGRGRIILDPRISVPASEAWLFRNKIALSALARGLQDATQGKTVSLGSFAGFADDES